MLNQKDPVFGFFLLAVVSKQMFYFKTKMMFCQGEFLTWLNLFIPVKRCLISPVDR